MQHSCLFYESFEEALRAGARHLKPGLARNERCLFVTAPGCEQRARQTLTLLGVDVRARERRGDLSVLDAKRLYLKRGRFEPHSTISAFRSAIEQAGSEGRPGLRAVADMSWAPSARPEEERLIVYESEINRLAPLPAAGLCMYPRQRMRPDILHRTICAHPWIDLGGQRRENPYYVPPDEHRRGALALSPEIMLERLAAFDCGRQQQDESELLPILAHQFKSPLATIQGFAETLLRHPRAPERAEFLKTICRHSARLSHLVDELLVLGRIAGSWRAWEPVSVQAFIRRTAGEYRPLARRKRITLECSCPTGLRARSRRIELQQVLQSLLENALKLTPPGGRVAVSACRRSGMIEFAVSDTGPGVRRGEAPQVFERFFRGKAGRESDPMGTGLGLYIAKRIVEGQGGRIWVDDDVRPGACFRFSVPAA